MMLTTGRPLPFSTSSFQREVGFVDHQQTETLAIHLLYVQFVRTSYNNATIIGRMSGWVYFVLGQG